MIIRRTILTVLLAAAGAAFAPAQTGEWEWSVTGRGLLITSSKIYPNPDNPSFELRTATTPFKSGLGFGAELAVRPLGASYHFGLSIEYLSQVKSEMRFVGTVFRRVPVEEGYSMIPIEVGGQVYVPLGTQSWRVSMGGGVGAYFTDRVYSVAGVSAEPVGSRLGFGIFVSVNSEYTVAPGVSVAAGLKFRDPEVDVLNRFPASSVDYEGTTVPLQQGDIPSRINVDGMTVSLGVRVAL